MRYLRVKFGDNDFGWPVRDALRRLWGYINENNHGPIGEPGGSFSGITTPEIFVRLHKARALATMLERLFLLEDLAQEVESLTRGLYWKKVNWKEAVIRDPGAIDRGIQKRAGVGVGSQGVQLLQGVGGHEW